MWLTVQQESLYLKYQTQSLPKEDKRNLQLNLGIARFRSDMSQLQQGPEPSKLQSFSAQRFSLSTQSSGLHDQVVHLVLLEFPVSR